MNGKSLWNPLPVINICQSACWLLGWECGSTSKELALKVWGLALDPQNARAMPGILVCVVIPVVRRWEQEDPCGLAGRSAQPNWNTRPMRSPVSKEVADAPEYDTCGCPSSAWTYAHQCRCASLYLYPPVQVCPPDTLKIIFKSCCLGQGSVDKSIYLTYTKPRVLSPLYKPLVVHTCNLINLGWRQEDWNFVATLSCKSSRPDCCKRACLENQLLRIVQLCV